VAREDQDAPTHRKRKLKSHGWRHLSRDDGRNHGFCTLCSPCTKIISCITFWFNEKNLQKLAGSLRALLDVRADEFITNVKLISNKNAARVVGIFSVYSVSITKVEVGAE